MIFRAPMPFAEALESRAVRQILPTDFRTRLLQAIAPELKERAMFSAGVTNVEFLQRAADSIDSLLQGESDRATKRAELKKLLDSLQYRPVPDERGTLTDLSSDSRLNLIIDTGVETAQGAGNYAQGMDEDVLDQFPAWELIRVANFGSEKQRDWPARWAKAGGEFYGNNQMIALKTDRVWSRLGDPDLFDDGLGNPYPPFAFNSGMDVRNVDRDTAVGLGVITRDRRLKPQSRDFNLDLKASPEVRSSSLKEALLENLGDNGIEAKFVDGVLRFVGGAA